MKTWKEIASMKDYNKYSKATICSHMKRKIDDPVIDKRKHNKGQPQKLSQQNKCNVMRQVEILRKDYRYFTSDSRSLLAYPRIFQTKIFQQERLRNSVQICEVRKRLDPSVWTKGV